MDKHLPSKKGKDIITTIAGVLFLLIATFHFLRSIWQLPATIGGWEVPLWVSWIATVAGVYLAWLLFHMDRT